MAETTPRHTVQPFARLGSLRIMPACKTRLGTRILAFRPASWCRRADHAAPVNVQPPACTAWASGKLQNVSGRSRIHWTPRANETRSCLNIQTSTERPRSISTSRQKRDSRWPSSVSTSAPNRPQFLLLRIASLQAAGPSAPTFGALNTKCGRASPSDFPT